MRHLMHHERHAWHSPATGRTMALERWGDWGPPVVYLPTSGGDERELVRYGFHEVARPWIESRRLQLVSVDGGGPWTLWSRTLSFAGRARAWLGLARYAGDELLPWVARTAQNDRLAIVGASYGAFVGAHLLLGHAPRVRLFCGLGGVYEMQHRLGDLDDPRFRAATPLAALPGLGAERLAALSEVEAIELHAAADDVWLDSTLRLAGQLTARGVPHELSILPSPADHHERWWTGQLRGFLGRRYGSP